MDRRRTRLLVGFIDTEVLRHHLTDANDECAADRRPQFADDTSGELDRIELLARVERQDDY
jgi:hypothetical protein